ncbi:peptidase S49 [Deltaproteobacteria bacterium Smac51]|nr:peptidase S49 [Deltaproteobacteria bacterium Smac51]
MIKMPLSDLLTPAPWAIQPAAFESISQTWADFSSRRQGKNTAVHAAMSTSQDDGGDGGLYLNRDGVAIIEARGVIHRSSGRFLCFGWAGQDSIRAAVDAAMADRGIHALLLSFDSPGGVAAGVKELADHIAAQTAKPVYAYADGLCASAAYWLASATGRVYAPATATVGSIGVIQVHCDRSGANTAEGLRYTYITGGTWKAAGNSDAPLSGADQAYMQGLVDNLHDIFRSDVASRTQVDAANPAAWGDGQVFLAEEAMRLGLIKGLVRDREALIAQINEETIMNREQLAKAHPELLAEIVTEAGAKANAELKASIENYHALVELVAGPEAAATVGNLYLAGVTPEQVKAMGPLLKTEASTQSTTATQESESRREILNALHGATPGPVPAAVAPKPADQVQAAIDRISAVS